MNILEIYAKLNTSGAKEITANLALYETEYVHVYYAVFGDEEGQND